MGRKRKYPDYPLAGRPPKNPDEKVGRPVRALVTAPIMTIIEEVIDTENINLSDFLRLSMYHYLRKMGKETQAMMTDPTFDTLREKGLL